MCPPLLVLLTEFFRNADGLVEDKHGNLILVEPYETQETFAAFLDYVQADAELTEQKRVGRNVKYAQTRK